MDVKKAIQERKSIRLYKDKEVPRGLLLDLIEAARLAPTARNVQPLRIKVVRKGDTLCRLKEAGVFPQEFVYTAPLILVCYGDLRDYIRAGSNTEFWIWCDISIQTAFLVLRATELGLSTCYIGKLDREKAKRVLGIPQKCKLPYAITVGYAAEQGRPRKRLPLQDLFEEV